MATTLLRCGGEIWKFGNGLKSCSVVVVEAMTHSYFVRITRAYNDVSGLIVDWSHRCQRLVCYEHLGTETEKIHIHVLLVDCEVEKKMLKTMALKSGYNLNGNRDWSWKVRKDLTDTPMVYMTKGNLDPKCVKGYTDDEVKAWKTKWVEKREESVWEKVYDYCFDDENYYEAKKSEWMADIITLHEAYELEFRFLLRYTQQMVFNYNKRIWSPQTANQYKCCVITRVMRTGMLIPPAYKDWNKFL